MADTVDLGSTARAWGFESLRAHQRETMKIFGEELFAKDSQGRLISRIGTLFLKSGTLVTKRGVHAMQRVMWIAELNRLRAEKGMESLTRKEEEEEIAFSVDLIFNDDVVLVRPDPSRMDLAFAADAELQKIVSKRRIRFLNTHSSKVRNALMARGENWRMARAPISQDDIKNLISSSRVALSGEPLYYYNSVTGTRYITVEGASRILSLPPEAFRAHILEAQGMLSRRNRIGHPELDIFPVTTPVDIKLMFKNIRVDRLSDTELRRAFSAVDAAWRETVPAQLRDESVENFEWRNEMCRTLTRTANDCGADEDELVQGISPEFYRQIEWLPGVRIDDGEAVFDPLWDEAASDPEAAAVCDMRAKSILFDFTRFYGDVEYVNIGRIARSLARQPIEGSRRGSVYIVQYRSRRDGEDKVRIIRFQKWGTAEHLDEGKDLLASINEADEYTDYIVDRRLMCMQLGMNLPERLVVGRITEKYTGGSKAYSGVTVRTCYFARAYVPGVASDKIPPAKFRNPAYALAFARLMGAAAAVDLAVGRRSTETKENLFDKNCEVVQIGRDSLPERLVVTDHGGSFVNYLHSFEESVAPYANVVLRRRTFVSDFEAFSEAFVSAFEESLRSTRDKYRMQRRAYDRLFASRPYDEAGSGAYRWKKTLERLDASDPAAVAGRLRKAIKEGLGC